MKRKKINSYTPGWPMRGFMLLVGFAVAAIHVFAIRSAGLQEMPLPLIAFILLADATLLWWMIVFSSQSRVTLYDEGIELERGASKVFTPWSNVSHLGVKGFGRNRRRGIYLHTPVSPETKGLVEKLFFGRASDFIPIGRYVNLPTNWNPFSREIDKDKLLETEFGKDLYELAPHLFGVEEKPKHSLEDEYNEDVTFDTQEEQYNETQEN
jgi:hypothetical protein